MIAARSLTCGVRRALVALLLAVCASCAMVAGAAGIAWAATDAWTVTFTGSSMTSDGSADINKRLSGMQPGDSATFSVRLFNDCDEEASWYMKNSVLESMETELAQGGSYTYRLTYVGPDGTEETIIGNEVVSGEGANSEGLFDATTATGEWFFLDKIPAHGQGTVTLFVALDPESHGNSYFDTQARLQLEFAAEAPGGSIVTEGGGNPSGGGNGGGSGTPGGNEGFRLPSTGDMVRFGLPILAVVVAIVAFFVARKGTRTKEEGGKQ